MSSFISIFVSCPLTQTDIAAVFNRHLLILADYLAAFFIYIWQEDGLTVTHIKWPKVRLRFSKFWKLLIKCIVYKIIFLKEAVVSTLQSKDRVLIHMQLHDISDNCYFHIAAIFAKMSNFQEIFQGNIHSVK